MILEMVSNYCFKGFDGIHNDVNVSATGVFECKTTDFRQCLFSFEYQGKEYFSCTNDVGIGKQCRIDDHNFGVCQSDCPGGKL